MAINPFDRPAGLPPIDFDFLFRTKEYNDRQEEKITKEYDALASTIGKIKAVPQDQPLRNKLVVSYNDQLKNWVDKYGENPRAGMSELRRLKRDFEQNFQYGQLGDIHGKGLQYEDLLKTYNEEAAKGTFKGLEDVAYYNMVAAPLNRYQQSKEIAPGIFNKINWGNPRQYADLGEDFDKFAQQWASEKRHGKLQRVGNGYLGTESREFVSEEEVARGVMAYAYSNPKYAGQFKDMANYYQAQTDANTQVTPEGIEFVTGTDGKGNPVYMRPPSGEETVKQYVRGIGSAIAMREGFDKFDIGYQQDWKEKWYMDEAAKKKEQEMQMATYATPSYVVPGNYWDVKLQEIDKTAEGGTRPYTDKEIEQLYEPYGGRSGLARMPGTRAEAIEERIRAQIERGKYIPASTDASGKAVLPEKYKNDLEKASILFGAYPTQYNDQIKLLKKYYDYSKTIQVDMPVNAPAKAEDFVKQANAYNEMYFGNVEGGKGKGSVLSSSSPVIVLGGDGKPQVGSDVMQEYGDLEFRYQGDAPVSNPTIYSAGRVFMGIDPNTKEQKVRILVPGSYQEQAQASLKHSMYQPKFTGSPVAINLEGKSYIVDYVRESKQELTDKYSPQEEDKGTAILKDATGKEIYRFRSGEVNPKTGLPENDAVKGLYESISK